MYFGFRMWKWSSETKILWTAFYFIEFRDTCGNLFGTAKLSVSYAIEFEGSFKQICGFF